MTKYLCVALLLSLAGCGGSASNREPDEYTGCGSDENWRTFEDQEHLATVADATAPTVTSPAAGATIASADKVKLTWQQDANDPGAPDGNVPYMGPGCNMCCPQFNTGSLSTLHLPPISGSVYDLQFTVAGKVDHRVITTIQEWTASDAVWASWKGKSVELKIYRMALLQNEPKEGPFTSLTPFAFSVN